MNKEIKERSLVTSLLSLKNRCTIHFDFEKLDEFIPFYNEMLNALKNYSEQKNSRFVQEKLQEFPVIRAEDYRGSSFINTISGSSILSMMFFVIIELYKYRMRKRLGEKLMIVASVCDSITAVLSHPGLEEMIYQEK